MDRSLSAVEAMLGHKLNNEERWLYHTTKSDPRYEYFVNEKGSLATEFKEHAPVPHLIYNHETTAMSDKVEKR